MTRPAIRFPLPDWNVDRSPRSQDAPRTMPILALLWAIAGCWLLWVIGYVSGKNAERGSELARIAALVVAGPTVDSLVAENRAALARWDALTNHAGRPAKARPTSRATGMPSGLGGATAFPAEDAPRKPNPTP